MKTIVIAAAILAASAAVPAFAETRGGSVQRTYATESATRSGPADMPSALSSQPNPTGGRIRPGAATSQGFFPIDTESLINRVHR
jgi:hypothetical protein